jgi:anti-anti-sigma factor
LSEHEFHVESSQADGAVVYRMRGVLGDTQHCHDFHESFQAGLADSPARIVLNLGGLENLYSAGIGIIASCFTSGRAAGKRVVLCCCNSVIKRSLTLTGVMPLLPDFDTEDEAITASLE